MFIHLFSDWKVLLLKALFQLISISMKCEHFYLNIFIRGLIRSTSPLSTGGWSHFCRRPTIYSEMLKSVLSTSMWRYMVLSEGNLNVSMSYVYYLTDNKYLYIQRSLNSKSPIILCPVNINCSRCSRIFLNNIFESYSRELK
jgi:hypothetical protein